MQYSTTTGQDEVLWTSSTADLTYKVLLNSVQVFRGENTQLDHVTSPLRTLCKERKKYCMQVDEPITATSTTWWKWNELGLRPL